MAEEDAIRITSFDVSAARVDPGQTVTVEVAFTGPGNIGVRQTIGSEGIIPGWSRHGAGHAFLPGSDFPVDEGLKTPEHFHRDNGALDLDERSGRWRAELSTEGWPEGTYSLNLMVCNRPHRGEFTGQSVSFQLIVGEPLPLQAETGDLAGFRIAINDIVLDGRNPEAPITPGHANRMTVTAAAEVLSGGGLVAELRRELPEVPGEADALSVQTEELTEAQNKAIFDLGAFVVPAAFDFTGGRLRRRGTRFVLLLRERDGQPRARLVLAQTVGQSKRRDVVRAMPEEWVYHLGFRGGGSKPLDPPVLMSLDSALLRNPDDVVVCLRLRSDTPPWPEAQAEGLPGRLILRNSAREEVWSRDVSVAHSQTRIPMPALLRTSSETYSISFSPQVPGSADAAGPRLRYRYRQPDPDAVQVSPLAPWTLQRDSARETVDLQDMGREVATATIVLPPGGGWELKGEGSESAVIHAEGDWQAEPVEVRLPGIRGWYAVFAESEADWTMVRIGDDVVRGVRSGPAFVDAADLTDCRIRIYPVNLPGAGLRRLQLIPVTQASVEAFRDVVENPPRSLRGVADWCDYFAPPPVHHSGGGRLAEDQLELLVRGHGELGMRSIAWSIGRSWIEYHTDLPQATRFPCAPLESIDAKYQRMYTGRTVMINKYRPLQSVIMYGQTYDVDILPWLSMQRHYGEAYGGIFSSEWFKANPQWRRVSKNGAVSSSTVCYHFEEVRQERCRILGDVATKEIEAVVVGCCRQVPMLLYHPQMVAAFQEEHGVDPRTIDAADEEAYGTWITWRAERFTQTLRDLRKTLETVKKPGQEPVRIVVRIPSTGLFYNLAQGLDVRRWLDEGLVDELQVEPLEDCNGNAGDHDLRPYLQLADAAGVPLLGAVNGNTWHNVTAILKRAVGILKAGADGIEIYESNNFAISSDRRWLVPLLGNPEKAEQWLQESNLEAIYPVWSRHAASGFDNHSFGGGWTVYGRGGQSL